MNQEIKENEESKVENSTPTEEANLENKSGNKKHSLLWCIFATLLIVAIVIAVFASNVFGKVSARKVFSISQNNAVSKFYENMLKDVEISTATNATLSIDTESLSTLFGDYINWGLVSLKTENVKEDSNASGKISLLIDEQKIIGADYAKTGDLYGVAVDGLFKNYVAIENNNLKALYKKIYSDVADEDLAKVPDRIEAIDFNDEGKAELKTIGKKYVGTLSEFYEKNAIAISNVSIEVCGENVNTTKYNLNINNENGYKLLNDLLKISENDEELYNFIKKYDAKGNLECDSFEEWQEAVKNIRDEIQSDISNEAYDAGIIAFNIYERNGIAVRYELELSEFDEIADSSLMLDAIENDAGVCGMLTYKTNGDYKTEYSISINMNKASKVYNGKCTLNIAISDLTPVNIEFASFEVDLQDDASIEIVKLTNENTLVLNTATDEEVDSLTGEIKKNLLTLAANMVKNLPENIKARLVSGQVTSDEIESEVETVITDAED